jgi:hypothetical protein
LELLEFGFASIELVDLGGFAPVEVGGGGNREMGFEMIAQEGEFAVGAAFDLEFFIDGAEAFADGDLADAELVGDAIARLSFKGEGEGVEFDLGDGLGLEVGDCPWAEHDRIENRGISLEG